MVRRRAAVTIFGDGGVMRFARAAVAAALFAAIPALMPAAAFAAPPAEEPDQPTLDKVLAAATKGYARPEVAKIRNVRKSLAVNGTGYCGEITVEEEADNGVETYTTFHVVLETPSGPSVLRLSDFKTPETDPQAATVHQMMRNFGCIK
jgi:hypothetical protein